MSLRKFGSFFLSLIFGPAAERITIPFATYRNFEPGEKLKCTDPDFLKQTGIDVDHNGIWEVIEANGEDYNYGTMYDVKAPDGSVHLLLARDLSRFFVADLPLAPVPSLSTPHQGPSS